MGKNKPRKPKLNLDQILGRSKPDPKHFVIDTENKTDLILAKPARFPRNGEMVAVSAGSGLPTNVLYLRKERKYKSLEGPERVEKKLICSEKFYFLQVVSYWEDGCQYDFQIQPTGIEGVGKFVLINKTTTTQQPGVGARKSRGSSIGSMI